MSNPEYTPYLDALTEAMKLTMEDDKTIFIGQQIVYYGNPMSKTIEGLPKERMIETPVMEETQMGMTMGLAMTGHQVVTFYPRWDFLILACNQLINHLDKLEAMSDGEWKPNVIVRLTADCPLIDCNLIDNVISLLIKKKLTMLQTFLIELIQMD